MEEEKVITGYKGFDKDMKCRGFQYEAGKEYETDEAVLCEKGFHFCKNPHDVFGYYPAGEGNRFALVEAKEVSDERENDSKRVCKKLKINAEISVFDICKIAVQVFFENFGFKKKIESADTTNAGDFGAAIVSNGGKVKGGFGCILVARSIKWDKDNNRYVVSDWACGIVDGVNIKEDTWYHLVDGKLVECEEQ